MTINALINELDRDQAIRFLQSLVQINSVNPPGNERKIVELITKRFEHYVHSVQKYKLDTNREDVFITLKGSDTRSQPKRHLILSGHLDTVPTGNQAWKTDPWSALIQDGKLYGRGASDMKSGVAAMVLTLELIAKSGIKLRGDLSFLGTAGEEIDGRGARLAIQERAISNATALVIGEPTNNQLCIAHKGVLWLEIIIGGKAAHAGWPDAGVNAISAMHQFIDALEHFKSVHDCILGNSTVNLGLISGGIAPNMVADTCKLTIDFRTVPGLEVEGIYNYTEEILKKISEKMNVTYRIKVLNDMHYVSTPKENLFIQLSGKVFKEMFKGNVHFGGANYYSDGSLFTKENSRLPILIFGPGDPNQAHQLNEWVYLDYYFKAIHFYLLLAIQYLGVEDQ
ncbi:M20 family metallopeptidase [Sporolactobacillus terrae]|uniref:M20 family metallopeptidase n=1 Tax=Sporolactobacillus terrae TaxID=269673 RepID=UPI001118C71E|nr:M20 family metallopeptidase [Sporolactobacillus terrae]